MRPLVVTDQMTTTPIPPVTNTTMATTALSPNCILSWAVADHVSAVLPRRALGLGLHPGRRGGRGGAPPRRGGARPQHRWWTLACARAGGSSSHPIQVGGCAQPVVVRQNCSGHLVVLPRPLFRRRGEGELVRILSDASTSRAQRTSACVAYGRASTEWVKDTGDDGAAAESRAPPWSVYQTSHTSGD